MINQVEHPIIIKFIVANRYDMPRRVGLASSSFRTSSRASSLSRLSGMAPTDFLKFSKPGFSVDIKGLGILEKNTNFIF